MCERGREGARRKNTGGVGRERGTGETAAGRGERRPRLATEKAKLPASANWFSGISRLQVVVIAVDDENNDEDGDDGNGRKLGTDREKKKKISQK